MFTFLEYIQALNHGYTILWETLCDMLLTYEEEAPLAICLVISPPYTAVVVPCNWLHATQVVQHCKYS